MIDRRGVTATTRGKSLGGAMNAKQRAKYEARAKVIKALAHPTRLLLVDEIARHGERCVCDLTEVVGADMSTVSRHLSQLREAGIVAQERRGVMIYYSMRVKCLNGFFNCVESVLQSEAKKHYETLT